MSELFVAALLKLLLEQAGPVVVALLREAGILPADTEVSETHLARAVDVLGDVNPMAKVRRAPDPATSDYFPPEYEKP